MSLDELVYYSQHVLVAQPLESHSAWQEVGARRRIVTFTRISVEQPVDGKPPARKELLVRTLGGRVGDLAQVVPGEARLIKGRHDLLFVSPDRYSGELCVTGMAQGHYALRPDLTGELRVMGSPDLPALKRPQDAALHRLMGRSIPDVEQLVLDCLARSGAPHPRD